MRLFKASISLAVSALALCAANTANAVIYTLNLSADHPTLTAPYGQVEVTQSQTLANTLDFVVTLQPGLGFLGGGGAEHRLFSFDLVGTPTQVTLSGLDDSYFTLQRFAASERNNLPFTGFGYAVHCTTVVGSPCRAQAGGYTSPLSFSITRNAGLTLGMLQAANSYQGSPVLFAANVIEGPNGVRGTIGGGAVVPEPSTWAMMITGFGAAGAVLRRRREARTAA